MNYKTKGDYQKNKKPGRQNNNYKNPQKNPRKQRYRKPKRNYYDDEEDYEYEQTSRRKNEIYIYKQDLIQIGLKIAEDKDLQDEVLELAESYPECMLQSKRKVISTGYDKENSHINKSKLTMKEDLKEGFEDIIGNEDIPDWFLEEEEGGTQGVHFDFGMMAKNTMNFKNEIHSHFKDLEPIEAKRDHEGIISDRGVEEEKGFEELDNLDFNGIDDYLEKKIKRELQIGNSFDEDGMFKSESEEVRESLNSKKEESSVDNSKDYFNNLQNNIKKILFNEKSEEEEVSNDSFEDLGFANYRRDSGLDLSQNKKEEKKEVSPEESKVEEVKNTRGVKDFKEDKDKEEFIVPAIIENTGEKKAGVPMISEVLKGFDLKSHIEERKKITEEEKTIKKNIFINKYGYMDMILCQVVTEMLRNRKKNIVNKHSYNGFHAETITKYKQFKYKIFSLFLQGNVISKVWLYKNKEGEIHGPYMSFDMDIWNSEGFFEEGFMIAIGPSPFLPASMFIDRDPICLELIEEFRIKALEISEKMTPPATKKNFNQKKKNNNNPHRGYKKKEEPVYVQKKKEINYEEDFPALGSEPTKKKETNTGFTKKKDNRKKEKEVYEQKNVKSQKRDNHNKKKDTQHKRDEYEQKNVKTQKTEFERKKETVEPPVQKRKKPHYNTSYAENESLYVEKKEVREVKEVKEVREKKEVKEVKEKKEVKVKKETKKNKPIEKNKLVEKTPSNKEEKVVKPADGNKELTANLKNLLGL